MARLIWTEPALADLDAIADYISLDKPEAAKHLVRTVYDAVQRLRRFPRSGRVPPELPDFPYREVVVSPCRVFYRVGRQTVVILHVARGEQEIRKDTIRGRDR